MIFMSTADVIDCDNSPCPESAKAQGYSSVSQYMIVNSAMWAVGNLLVIPTTYTVMLSGLSRIQCCFSPSTCRTAVCLMWIAVAYFYMSYLFGFVSGLVFFALVIGGGWIPVLGLFLVALTAWNFKLFGFDPYAGLGQPRRR
eukprot:gnl/TRDRNA2_/TRDRNA2_114755_c0_seq1.p1 gnl/TRDRNA2_/TRDRNA2_114755_c0~~gnl/TRDRNA2_/TRDRNA2_114755_c0_seq1.p1  ORF type:complete len:142 (-),score=10.24 gnl/TRDRNA2_/TRDRNA2_114755_c0_seq1:44-469(-)